jgi:hypothetical protein
MGGADQWGNIVTGTELIRRKEAGDAFAFTCKLITKSDGTKFGKSEGGNIWLDPAKTSPYQFYQFWLKLSDADVVNMAFVFSFKEVAAIKELVAQQEAAPHLRILQKELAKEMTILVHGEAAYEFALKASEILFAPTTLETLQSLSEAQLLDVLEGKDDWVHTAIQHPNSSPDGLPIIRLPYLVLMKLLAGRSQDLADISRMLGGATEVQLINVKQVIGQYLPSALEDIGSLIILGKLENNR